MTATSVRRRNRQARTVQATPRPLLRRSIRFGSALTAFYEARLKPGEDISVLLHDDARREELSRRAWSGEEP